MKIAKGQSDKSEILKSVPGPDRSCLFSHSCIWWRLHFPSFLFFCPCFFFLFRFRLGLSFSFLFLFLFFSTEHFQVNVACKRAKRGDDGVFKSEGTKQLHPNILNAGKFTTQREKYEGLDV